MGVDLPGGGVDALRYREQDIAAAHAGELALVKLRYKQPDADESIPLEVPVPRQAEYDAPGGDFAFASGVALFGMLLRKSPHAGTASYPDVLQLAEAGRGTDEFGYRAEFMELVRAARDLWGKTPEE
jgi:Ca-activated chloride channel family protein